MLTPHQLARLELIKELHDRLGRIIEDIEAEKRVLENVGMVTFAIGSYKTKVEELNS